MTFYAKPTNRPLALEGWFEKPKNRLFGHVRVKIVVYSTTNVQHYHLSHIKLEKTR
jgi:hypothetical protein